MTEDTDAVRDYLADCPDVSERWTIIPCPKCMGTGSLAIVTPQDEPKDA